MTFFHKKSFRDCAATAILAAAIAGAPLPTTANGPSHPSRLRNAASTAYRVVNLSKLLGGGSVQFVPTALNNLGQIAGYDAEVFASGDAGAAYIIDSNDTFHVLPETGISSEPYVPSAISSEGRYVAAEGTSIGTGFRRPQSGPAVWSLQTNGSYSLDYRRYTDPADSDLLLIKGLTDGKLAVGGYDYFTVPKYSVRAFFYCGDVAAGGLGYFFANAVNASGMIVGTAGGYAATGTEKRCSTYIPGLPRPKDTSTSAIAINAGGALILSIQGPAAPPYGSYYLAAGSNETLLTLPATYSPEAYYLDAVALSDGDGVVGNIKQQAPPFTTVAPFLYQNGRSIDVNTLLPAKSGWRLVTAAGINQAGEIVGTGYYGGVLSGYALLP